MSSAEPPLASAAIITPWKPADAWVGLPFSATLPRYSGLRRSFTLVSAGTLSGVVADRRVAAVVAHPEAVRVLELVGNVVPGRDLVGGEQIGVAQRDVAAEVEHVRRAVLAAQLVRGVDLVLAVGVRLGAVDLDAVLLRERLDHLAVVRPVRRQRDDVQLTFFLCGRDQLRPCRRDRRRWSRSPRPAHRHRRRPARRRRPLRLPAASAPWHDCLNAPARSRTPAPRISAPDTIPARTSSVIAVSLSLGRDNAPGKTHPAATLCAEQDKPDEDRRAPQRGAHRQLSSLVWWRARASQAGSISMPHPGPSGIRTLPSRTTRAGLKMPSCHG